MDCMDRETVLLSVLVLLVSAGVGFSLGTPELRSSAYRENVDFTANASNPIEEVIFDERSMSIIVQPGQKASFFINVNGTVEPLEGLQHDGEVHELRKFVTLEGKMYLLNLRYSDDSEEKGDEWLKLYRIIEL